MCNFWEQWYTISKGKLYILQIYYDGLIYLTYFILIIYFFLYVWIYFQHKVRNNTVEALFGILGATTELKNDMKFQTFAESEIGFLS